MSRTKQKLINYNTSGKTTQPLTTDVDFGEIVVRHNYEQPELLIKVDELGTEKFVAFGDKVWVNQQIATATGNLETSINQTIANVSGAVNNISGYIITYVDQRDAALQGQIDSTNRELGYVSSSTVALSGVVESFSGVVYRDYATKKYVDDKIDTVETSISNLQTTVNDFSGATYDAFDAIYEDYATSANVHTTIDGLNTQVGYLSGATSALSAVVASFSAATENTFVDKSTYSGYTASTNTSITNLQTNLNNLSGVTSALSANVITALDEIVSSITADITSVYKYKGSKDTYAELPDSNNEVGDVWNVVEAVGEPGQPGYTPAGTNYAWDGEQWDALGGTVDLSAYALDEDLDALDTKVTNLETKVNDFSGATFSAFSGVYATYATSADVHTTIDGLTTEVGHLSSSTVALSGVVATLSANTESTFVDKSTYSAYTGNVNTTITNIQGDLNDLSGATYSAFSGVYATYATSADVHTTIDGLNTKVENLSGATTALSETVISFSGAVYNDYARKVEDLKPVSDKIDALDTDVRSNLSASTVALSGVVETIQQTAGNAITGVELGQVTTSTSAQNTLYASGAKVNSTSGQNAIIDLSELIIDCGTF